VPYSQINSLDLTAASYRSRWSLCSLRKQIILKESTAQHKQAHKGHVLINCTLYNGRGTRKKGLGRQRGVKSNRKRGLIGRHSSTEHNKNRLAMLHSFRVCINIFRITDKDSFVTFLLLFSLYSQGLSFFSFGLSLETMSFTTFHWCVPFAKYCVGNNGGIRRDRRKMNIKLWA
jgi:hypothetical protein